IRILSLFREQPRMPIKRDLCMHLQEEGEGAGELVELYICKLPIKKKESDLNKLLVHVSTERQRLVKMYVKLDVS
uniref:hypothetical protein n=1 Tax=Peribacillus frigoritolerans TaxID=450367 RepID=UPI0020BE6000